MPHRSDESCDDELLAEFLAELDQDDFRTVVERYCVRYPEQAEQIRAIAAMHRIMDATSAREFSQFPHTLDDFRLLRPVARGGMGVVFDAVQETLGRRVAVKLIRLDLDSEDARSRFLREQRALAHLHHSNIVTVFAGGKAGPLRYFAMPYIEGVTLEEIVRRFSECREQQTLPPGLGLPELARISLKERGVGDDESAGPGEEAGLVIGADRSSRPSSAADESHSPTGSRLRAGSSLEYFRSVAAVMADVAEALQHAHVLGFLHRDMKPSNVMIDVHGTPWVIDFGLSGLMQEAAGASISVPEAEGAGSAARGILGTPQYMAPEQFERLADVRTDVWGLGVTLYELLVFRKARDGNNFDEVRNHVQHGSATPPSEITQNLPRDLEAICLRAIRKNPDDRYQTAAEFAEDLRRWLRGEATSAYPLNAQQRVWRWARRNPGWAAALTATLVGLLITGVIGWVYQFQLRRSTARHSRILAAQSLIRAEHRLGWSAEARRLIGEAAAIRHGTDLRSHIIPTLAGLDAAEQKRFPYEASYLAFHPDDHRLLMSSFDSSRVSADVPRTPINHDPPQTSIWNSVADTTVAYPPPSAGPVAFDRGGVPLQLVRTGNGYEVWDLASGSIREELQLPAGWMVGGWPRSHKTMPAVILAPDGSHSAASVTDTDGRELLVVWQVLNGIRLELHHSETTSLAFSPDGRFLAAGSHGGSITLWDLVTSEVVAELRSSSSTVHSLCFGRDASVELKGQDGLDGWLLAAGQHGQIAIWSLGSHVPRSYCYGSKYDVYALAFSPDGMTLASSGRHETRLWDIATGRSLLLMVGPNTSNALSFSSDGRLLAVGAENVFGVVCQTTVWKLQTENGVRRLRGLSGSAARVAFSPDGGKLAALSHNWEVAVWDLERTELLHLLQMPAGLTVDNAAIEFNSRGTEIAFSALRLTSRWSVGESARQLSSWRHEEGFVDQLAFRKHDESLLLFRCETASDGEDAPNQVFRLYELAAASEKRILWEQPAFTDRVFRSAAASDGSVYLVVGQHRSTTGQPLLQTIAYDGASGDLLWILDKGHNSGSIEIDPSATQAAVFGSPGPSLVVDLLTAQTLEEVNYTPFALSPSGTYRVGGQNDALRLFARGSEEPLLMLEEPWGETFGVRFSFDGQLVAWPMRDGSVCVAEIETVRERLGEMGLGWNR